MVRPRTPAEQLFEQGHIHLSTGAIHTVKPLEADFPKGKLTVVTGVSGSGKTTLVLESLIPALEAATSRRIRCQSMSVLWKRRASGGSS